MQAQLADAATAVMLAEQGIDSAPDASLNTGGITTAAETVSLALDSTETDFQFWRLVASLTQDAARAAQGITVASRPRIYHVRYVNPPCCSRCAILAGRVYPFSTGFERHPGCDCSMIPTTVASPLRQNPHDLVARGLVTDLSKADHRALADGADLNQVVNVRSKAAGLNEPGRVLTRAGRPSPEGIYRIAAGDRDRAVALLAQHGYLR